MDIIRPNTYRHALLSNLCQHLFGSSIIEFQKEWALAPDNIIGAKTYGALYQKTLAPKQCKSVQFPSPLNKRQIVIHHTAGADNGENVYLGWERDNMPSVATSLVIDRSGRAFKGFDESMWAHHLGTKFNNNTALNQASIAVELTNWGALEAIGNNQFKNYVGGTLPAADVCQVSYRNHNFWQTYPAAQLATLEYWIIFNAARFNIPIAYQEDMWDVSLNAINGRAGIYTHTSYRKDKIDCSPQPQLVNMLKGLEEKYNPNKLS